MLNAYVLLAPQSLRFAARLVVLWSRSSFLAAGSALTICFDESKHSIKVMCRQL
jgi:hypothetical protein